MRLLKSLIRSSMALSLVVIFCCSLAQLPVVLCCPRIDRPPDLWLLLLVHLPSERLTNSAEVLALVAWPIAMDGLSVDMDCPLIRCPREYSPLWSIPCSS